MPRKRRRSRRTSFNFTRRARRSSKRRSSRRASSGFGSNRKIAGMVSTSMLTSAAAGVAGFVGCQLLLDKIAAQFNIDAVKVGNGRIVGKAAAAIIAGIIAKKLGAPTHLASAIAGGGLIAAGVDVYSKIANKPAGTAGMGVIEVDGNPYLDYRGIQLGLDDGDDDGMGAYGYNSTAINA